MNGIIEYSLNARNSISTFFSKSSTQCQWVTCRYGSLPHSTHLWPGLAVPSCTASLQCALILLGPKLTSVSAVCCSQASSSGGTNQLQHKLPSLHQGKLLFHCLTCGIPEESSVPSVQWTYPSIVEVKNQLQDQSAWSSFLWHSGATAV